jgi:hypothetical protein
MGRSSVDATNVLRICAVRAIRSALVARLPLLAGLCLPDVLLLADVFVAPGDLAFALLAPPALLPDVFFLLVIECLAAGS